VGAELFGSIGDVAQNQLRRQEAEARQALVQEQEIYANKIAGDFETEANIDLENKASTVSLDNLNFQEDQVKSLQSKRKEALAAIKDKEVRKRVDYKLSDYESRFALAAERVEIENRKIIQEKALDQSFSDSVGAVRLNPSRKVLDYEIAKHQESFKYYSPAMQRKKLTALSGIASNYVVGRAAQLEKRFVLGEISSEAYRTDLQLLKTEMASEIPLTGEAKSSLAQFLDHEEMTVLKAGRAANAAAIQSNAEANLELYEQGKAEPDIDLILAAQNTLAGDALDQLQDKVTVATALQPINVALNNADPETADRYLSKLMAQRDSESASGNYKRAAALDKAVIKAQETIEDKRKLINDPAEFAKDDTLASTFLAQDTPESRDQYITRIYTKTRGRVPVNSLTIFSQARAAQEAAEFSNLTSNPQAFLNKLHEMEEKWSFSPTVGSNGFNPWANITRQLIAQEQSGTGPKMGVAFAGALPWIGKDNPHAPEIVTSLAIKPDEDAKQQIRKATLDNADGYYKKVVRGLRNSGRISSTSYNAEMFEAAVRGSAAGLMTTKNLGAKTAVKEATEKLLYNQVEVFDAGWQSYIFDRRHIGQLSKSEKENVKLGLSADRKLIIGKALTDGAIADKIQPPDGNLRAWSKLTPEAKIRVGFASELFAGDEFKLGLEKDKAIKVKQMLDTGKWLPVGNTGTLRLHYQEIVGGTLTPAVVGKDENGTNVFIEYPLKDFAEKARAGQTRSTFAPVSWPSFRAGEGQ
jgi:hypothetical protein